jgi:MYXO-CTERM domain-containing protein
VVQLKQAPILAIQPTGEEVQLAEVVTPPPTELEAAAPVVAEEQLPKTASPLPLIGLFGLLALGGAFALRSIARRVH